MATAHQILIIAYHILRDGTTYQERGGNFFDRLFLGRHFLQRREALGGETEFLFALILTGNKVPVITVVMAQFVTEMGLHWNLMAATAVMVQVLPLSSEALATPDTHR